MQFKALMFVAVCMLSSSELYAVDENSSSISTSGQHELQNLRRIEQLNATFGNYSNGELTPTTDDYIE